MMSISWVLAIAVSLASLASARADCPKHLPYYAVSDTLGNYCYVLYTRTQDFSHAEAVCKKHGGHLASIHSQGTNDFLVHLMRDLAHFHGEAWIGLNDRHTENTFIWLDKTKTDFKNFAKNEASRTGRKHNYEDCVALSSADQKWHDHKCFDFVHNYIRSKEAFICEFRIEATTNSTTVSPNSTDDN